MSKSLALGFSACFALAAGCATAVGIEDEINEHINSIRDGGTNSARTDAGQDARGGSSFTGGSGNLGSGGMPPSSGGAGGSGALGGTGGSTGKAGSGGSMGPTDAPCASGLKRCGGVCVTPVPPIGCAPGGCDPCPQAPANSVAVCRSNECAFDCIAGYVAKGGRCEVTGSGGTGGTGGTGGSGGSGGTGGSGSCNLASCGPCNIAGPFPCCRVNNTCGCTWAPGTYCL